MIALELMKRGFRNVKVVRGGWAAMIKAGFPVFINGKVHIYKKETN